MVKYADDATLIVPASNRLPFRMSLPILQRGHALITKAKPKHYQVLLANCFKLGTRGYHTPPLLPDIPRVDNLLLLGVVLDSHGPTLPSHHM